MKINFNSIIKRIKPSNLKRIIIYFFTFIPETIKKLKSLSNDIIHIKENITHIQINNNIDLSKKIFEKNKLDIMLDNIACPEEGRKLLYILFKLKNLLPTTTQNIIIARNSSVNGYLSPIIKQLQLKTIPLDTSLNLYLRKLPKTSIIYSLDLAFSILLLNNSAYLSKLRAQCKNEFIIAVKVDISKTYKPMIQNDTHYAIEKDELFYTDEYIRKMLHYIGFFEVLGPFTTLSYDHFIRSRLIATEGHYSIISNKKSHPEFRGISIYRATTKTFRPYFDSLI